MLITGVFIVLVVSQANGIGISPGRQTFDIPENGEGALNANITYWLFPPQGQYSSFRTLTPLGLNTTISGSSSTTGIEYSNDGSLLIDWEAAGNPSSISAYVNVSSPDNWQCPLEAGSARYLDDLVWHSEGLGPAIARVVSQIALYRNYALRGNIVGLQDSYLANTPVQFGLGVTDYADYAMYLERFKVAWSIDWESDGIIDESQSNIQMIGELGETNPVDIVTGFKYKNLDFEHAYSAPGDYLITLNLADRVETTTLQIPVQVIPEPATIALLGLGAVLTRKRKAVI